MVATGNASPPRKNTTRPWTPTTKRFDSIPTTLPPSLAVPRPGRRKHYRDRELADISMAIKLDPNNAAYRVARGESWSAQGRHKRAMADYDEAIRMEPNDPAKWVSPAMNGGDT